MNIELLRTRMVSYFQNMPAEDLVEKYKKLGYSFTESPEPSPTVVGKDWVRRYADLREKDNMTDSILQLVKEVAAASPVGGDAVECSHPFKEVLQKGNNFFCNKCKEWFYPPYLTIVFNHF